MPPPLEPEIADALAQIVIARNAAAAPLVFAADAAAESDERSVGQFRATLPGVPGGFLTVRDALLHASALFGALAKTIAQFDKPVATEITLEQMRIARTAAERACKLQLATIKNKPIESVSVSDGHICA